MSHRQRAAAIATLVLATCLPFILAAQPATAPEAAAKEWLAVVDKGDYQSSWDQAGSIFKSRMTAQVWGIIAATARAPLGAVTSRTTLKVTTSRTMAGQPNGQYAEVQFTSAFATKASAVETVSLQMESGHWAVMGYIIW
jgi:hypothetical protein